jgi:hypothetical protein
MIFQINDILNIYNIYPKNRYVSFIIQILYIILFYFDFTNKKLHNCNIFQLFLYLLIWDVLKILNNLMDISMIFTK